MLDTPGAHVRNTGAQPAPAGEKTNRCRRMRQPRSAALAPFTSRNLVAVFIAGGPATKARNRAKQTGAPGVVRMFQEAPVAPCPPGASGLLVFSIFIPARRFPSVEFILPEDHEDDGQDAKEGHLRGEQGAQRARQSQWPRAAADRA
jgi:hypothetical protein